MKIRGKIFLAVGTYLFIGALIGLVALLELNTVQGRLVLVEVADDVINDISEIRRVEKNFLLYRQPEAVAGFRQGIKSLRDRVDNFRTGIVMTMGIDRYEALKGGITAYEMLFDRVVANADAGNRKIDEVRVHGRRLETQLTGGDHETFLLVRKHEKNIIISEARRDYENFITAAKKVSGDPGVRTYLRLVGELFALFDAENRTVEEMRSKAREIQGIASGLAAREREAISATMSTGTIMLIASFLTILVLGAIVNTKLAMSIATPIRRLEAVTRKIAGGTESAEAVPAADRDEIFSLEVSFNLMEDRLNRALSSLEEKVQELREKQTQLVEAEKLASIGILASGIAHEINNPLTSVLTFSNLLLEDTPEDSPKRERLLIMVRETERARAIVRQLLSFGRETPIAPVNASLNGPVSEALRSLKARGAFEGITVKEELDVNLPDVHIDTQRMVQVILNLLLNAVQAITPPGAICVKTLNTGDAVELSISDTGEGIPEENLPRVFDPFFTTKDDAKGTGLGLAVCYGIIKKHGGDIAVKSEAGKGTTFTVRIPIHG